MQIKVGQCEIAVYDTEVDVLQNAAEQIAALPAGSVISLWPDLVGRQILMRVGKLAKNPLTIFTNGSWKGYDLADFLKPVINNSAITVTEKLPANIDVVYVNPRPTTFDAAVIQEDTTSRKYKIAQLIDDIGAEVGSEAANKAKNYDENDQSPVAINDLIKATKQVTFIFKGDLYKDACLGVLEKYMSIGGALLKAAEAAGKRITAITDVLSSSLLSQIQHPWIQEGFQWSNRSGKMAICQAAHKLEKRIQDLTVDDMKGCGITMDEATLNKYRDYTLKDLASRITTIPKSFFPKNLKLRVMLFSPHPDDDVISAGAAVAALAGQDNIEFHCTYCVSGNVSVPDSFVQQKIDEFKVQVHDDGTGNDLLGDVITYSAAPHHEEGKIQQVNYVTHYNLTAEEATRRFSTGCSPRAKGLLREVEAQSGLNVVDFFKKPGNAAHFMRLPFYGSGFGRRHVPGEEDIQRCVRLLKEVQPHVIFLAGDLSDPHGTHGHCYVVIKEAIERIEAEAMAKLSDEERTRLYAVYNTRVVKSENTVEDIYKLVEQHHISYKLMYRGAWAEFNVEDSTFIVKFTHDEMQTKMKCINEHRSQMGEALYLGGDSRPFDERAKERNMDTANILRKMGLVEAEFEGAECFVGCGFLP